MHQCARCNQSKFLTETGLAVMVALLTLLAAPSIVAEGIVSGDMINYVEFELSRADNTFIPWADFSIDFGVTIPAVPNPTSVEISCSSGYWAELEADDGVFWVQNDGFTDLETLKTSMNGEWTITISGDSPSTSTFELNAMALLDSDFFATPTDVYPPDGANDIPPDIIFSWSDPTGPEIPDVLIVGVRNNTDEQSDDSLQGTLEITDTSWDPPLDLSSGVYEFSVQYVNLGNSGLVSPLTVTSGSIEWGNSPFAPNGYPASTPLLILGSITQLQFEVVSICLADLDGNNTIGTSDLLLLLSSWGPCIGCPADFDESGAVGTSDLLILFANWGPCP